MFILINSTRRVILCVYIRFVILTCFSGFWLFWSSFRVIALLALCNSFSNNESFILLLIILCRWSYLLTLPVQERFFIELNSKLLLAVSTIFFTTARNLIFYVTFELSLIPITIIIMRYGLSNERLIASFYLFVYTSVVSLPLLIMLMEGDLFSNTNSNIILSPIQCIFLITAFIVKLPC